MGFPDEYDDPRCGGICAMGLGALPGLRLIDTRGHTQGHQSAIVELPQSGTIVLPFDAGDLPRKTSMTKYFPAKAATK